MTRLSLAALLLLLCSTPAAAQTLYLSSQLNQTFVPLPGGTQATLVNGNDDGHALVPIGFAFEFYGQPYDHVDVGVNGALNFVTPCSAGCAFDEICSASAVCTRAPLEPYPFDPPGLGSATLPNRVVAAFWDDLLFDTVIAPVSSIVYRTQGVAPNREFVVEWRNIRRWVFPGAPSVSSSSFQVRLEEGSNTIRLHYGPTVTGVETWSGFIGLESEGGVSAFAPIPCGGQMPGCSLTQLSQLAHTVFEISVPPLPELRGQVAALGGAQPGANVDVQVSAENSGPQPTTGPFESRIYLSTNSTIDASDTLIGSATFAAPVASGQTIIHTVTATIPLGTAPGFYRLGLITDAQDDVQEIVETNNITVAAQQLLVGSELSMRIDNPDALAPAAIDSVSFDIINSGGPEPSVDWALYLSSDQILDGSDVQIAQGSQPVPSGPDTPVVTSVNVPATPPGVYYVIGRVDASQTIAEADETNNVAVSSSVVVGPDLSASLAAPATLGVGTSGNFQLTLRNAGSGSPTAAWALYLSTDPLLDASDIALGSGSTLVPSLGEVPVSVTASIGAAPLGTYYALLHVDPADVVLEADEGNNLVVASSPTEVLGPDLVVTAIDGLLRAFRGAPYSVRVELRNSGAAAATDFYYTVHLSQNQTITINDPLLLEVGPVDLSPSELLSRIHVVTMPANIAPGPYFLGVIADWTTVVDEENEGNNILAFPEFPSTVELRDAAPDFSAPRVVGPTLAAAGEWMVVERTLENAGNAAGVLDYDVLIGRTPNVDATSIVVESASVALSSLELDSGRDAVRVPTSLLPGQYHVLYVLDPNDAVSELDESNNVTASPTLITVEPGALVVQTQSLPVATIDRPYEVALGARGGTGLYTWSVAGTLPEGLSLDATAGIVSGTPTVLGRSDVVFRVDDGRRTAERSLALVVAELSESLQIATRALPPAWVQRPYAYPLTAVGGVPPFEWSVDPALPTGLTLGTDGQIEGRGVQGSNDLFTFTVRDVTGAAHSEPLAFRVINADDTVRFDFNLLPDGTFNQDYEGRLRAVNGVSPYRFELAEGELPIGLRVEGDRVVGVPTALGKYTFKLRVTDARNDLDLNSYVVRIQPDGIVSFLTVTLPAGVVGDPYSDENGDPVRIKAIAGNGTGTVAFSLIDGGLPPGLALSSEGLITGQPELTGVFNFLVDGVDADGSRSPRALAIVVDADGSDTMSDPDETGCGCGSVSAPYRPGSGPGLLGLALLAGLLMLRRRLRSGRRARRTAQLACWAVVWFASPSVFAQAYTIETIASPYVPRSGGTVLSFNDEDDGQANVTLPFAFDFFTETYSLVTVGTNGYVTFDGFGSELSNLGIPSTSTPNALIAMFWDDLLLPTDGVTVYVEGNAPSRVVVIQYEGLRRFQSFGHSFSMQLHLFEGLAGHFEIHYGPTPGLTPSEPYSSTIGFEDAAGQIGASFAACSPGCNAQDLISLTDQVIRVRRDGGTDVVAIAIDNPSRAVHGVEFSVDLIVGSEHDQMLGPFDYEVHLLRPFDFEPAWPVANGTLSLPEFGRVELTVPIVLSSSVPEGRYQLALVVDSQDTIVEPNESNNLGVSSQVLTVDARRPDLSVEDVSVSPLSVSPGQTVDVEFVLGNFGLQATPADWTLVLSENRVLSVDDVVLDSGSLSLVAGQTSTITRSAVLPANLDAGRYYAGVIIDPADLVAESDELDNTGSAADPIRVGTDTLDITTRTLPGAYVGVEYAAYLGAHGGDGRFQWSLSAGTLPDGLTLLAATGEIRGTPTTAGESSFTIEVSSNGRTDSQALSIEVAALDGRLAIVTNNLLPGIVGQAYPPQPGVSAENQQRIRVVGGSGPVELTLVSEPPAGLSFDADGYLRGTPNLRGAFDVIVRANDGVMVVERSLPLTVIEPGRMSLVSLNLPEATVDVEYRFSLPVLGRVPTSTLTFSVIGGPASLPDGLTLTRAGLLVGVPERVGIWDFAVEAQESVGPSLAVDTANFRLEVETGDDFFVRTRLLPDATIGKPYEAQIEADRGRPPFTWRLVSEVGLPRGLSLAVEDDADERQVFVISGTPERLAPGTERSGGLLPFLVTVEDVQGRTADRALSLRVLTETSTTGPPPEDGGCGCHASRDRRSEWGIGLMGLLALVFLRRDRRRVR